MLNTLCHGILLVLVASTQCSDAGTVLKGGIYFDAVWTPKGSPYTLAKNVKIGKGTKVRVLPGVRIEGGGKQLTVDGTLHMFGSKAAPIILSGVHFVAGKTDAGDILLKHTAMSGGSIFSMDRFNGHKAALNLTDSSLSNVEPIYLFYPPRNMSILRNVFYRSGGISVGTDGVTVEVSNNLFFKQTTDYAIKNWARRPFTISQDVSDDGKNHWYPNDMIVRHNTFACTDQIALRLEPQYNDAYMLGASGNYFGSKDAEIVSAMVHDRRMDSSINSKIGYLPFLTKPHPLTPQRDGLICDDPHA